MKRLTGLAMAVGDGVAGAGVAGAADEENEAMVMRLLRRCWRTRSVEETVPACGHTERLKPLSAKSIM